MYIEFCISNVFQKGTVGINEFEVTFVFYRNNQITVVHNNTNYKVSIPC